LTYLSVSPAKLFDMDKHMSSEVEIRQHAKRPESTYKSGKVVQTTGASQVTGSKVEALLMAAAGA